MGAGAIAGCGFGGIRHSWVDARPAFDIRVLHAKSELPAIVGVAVRTCMRPASPSLGMAKTTACSEAYRSFACLTDPLNRRVGSRAWRTGMPTGRLTVVNRNTIDWNAQLSPDILSLTETVVAITCISGRNLQAEVSDLYRQRRRDLTYGAAIRDL